MSSNHIPICVEDVLIVDDSADNLRVLSTILAEQGYQVRKVINGNLALKVAQTAPPALILLDILMPDLDGYELCRLLKENPLTAKIPVIFISALDDIFDKVKAFEAGGVDYITKPFQAAEVLARVKSQLTIRDFYIQLQRQTQKLTEQKKCLQQEIKKRQRAEAETNLLLKITQAISASEDFPSALEVTLRQVCETIGWDLGEAWIPQEEREVLEYSRAWYSSEANLEKFQLESKKLTYAPNAGLPGRIWVSKQPEWIEDVSVAKNPVFFRSALAVDAGLKATFGIPIVLNNQVLTVLIFFKKEKLEPKQRLIELVNAVATQLGALVQRKKAEAALKEANLKLHRLATVDELTGVANRRWFNESLNQEWRRMARERLPLSLILCDLDYFKQYNDTYGHLVGDFCLQKIAQTISDVLKRPADSVARYGGEEFVIILPNTHADGALQIAENMRNEVESLKMDHAKSEISQYVTLSLGVVSLLPQNPLNPSILMAVADKALYQAKAEGRNRSVLKPLDLDNLEL
ncbi:diguanylate cyclase domain-containing protein [Microcoleus sp. FACHB-672]|uniref:diguanylate cyclase domain-containing protein n=1 Tax=Microcoleus sp. FACHB-672 TaxID=2692825 RepID=UPI0016833BBE|nr:diguanylate cyclase [Microcoleus sp. FACHB-672]MBD2043689.1 diguanylate cyclase [Microcoleus sp. FACHB-672]